MDGRRHTFTFAKKSGPIFLPFCLITRVSGVTDGRTDRILIARPRLHCMQRGQKVGPWQWSFRKLATMGTPKLSAEGAKFEAPKAPSIERRRRENRSAKGAERGGLWGEMSPPQPTRGSGERRKLPQRGPGRSPGRQRVLP